MAEKNRKGARSSRKKAWYTAFAIRLVAKKQRRARERLKRIEAAKANPKPWKPSPSDLRRAMSRWLKFGGPKAAFLTEPAA